MDVVHRVLITLNDDREWSPCLSMVQHATLETLVASFTAGTGKKGGGEKRLRLIRSFVLEQFGVIFYAAILLSRLLLSSAVIADLIDLRNRINGPLKFQV
ncbi:hypothetical protein TNIN_284171 [Trichonephila inaurata madagascariensis]|uniref:Uncharacterized protein n=1 Tax=Trichonephila inaurata madagascariensis TaxID=2747483 RepID=A0A8X6KKR7_9ARAC|nr:hypothetical protein TNIN_284171 [Trichonephila inaurata madagascariensis]